MDNYSILGLNNLATIAEIKAKYRQLIKIHHPDKGGDAQKFIAIRTAYVALLKGDAGQPIYRGQQGYQNPFAQQKYDAATDMRNRQEAYNYQSRQAKDGEYRFVGIKMDDRGYLISFYVENVYQIKIYGKNGYLVGTYDMQGDLGVSNLRISFEDAKAAKYIFECRLFDANLNYAIKTYKVKPPKQSVWQKIKEIFN